MDKPYTDRTWQSADGLTLHYRDYPASEGADPARPPIICLHGLTRNARDFADLAEHLAGEWRDGSGKALTNVSPWDESTIFEMQGATADDVDEAYRASAEAQKEWAKLPPAARSAKMHAIADILDARKDEIADWIVREVGGTKLKAALELMLVTQVARQEAAALPF